MQQKNFKPFNHHFHSFSLTWVNKVYKKNVVKFEMNIEEGKSLNMCWDTMRTSWRSYYVIGIKRKKVTT
jgi:hypothetical protein